MLHHPSIVPIYSVGTERGVHYYAMQLFHGQSMAEVIDEPSALERPAQQVTQRPPVARRSPTSTEPQNSTRHLPCTTWLPQSGDGCWPR